MYGSDDVKAWMWKVWVGLKMIKMYESDDVKGMYERSMNLEVKMM
jgi:hypothetical protein